MEIYNFSSILPLKEFLTVVNRDSLTFMKGKGRQFTSTAVGTVFMAAKFDKSKPAYIAFGGQDLKTKGVIDPKTGKVDEESRVSLKGTFWLVNAPNVTEGDTISAEV